MINRRALIGAMATAATALTAAFLRASRAEAAGFAELLKGRIVYKGDEDYELTREFSVWNVRKPKRYPEAIVMAESVDDVAAAVKLAKAKGWKVGVRSGGHSWYAAHMRDRSLLINLANMRELKIDPEAMIATISPSTPGHELNATLQDDYGLLTPSAHGIGVGMGGFVMCGGHGWNSRVFGPGCANLTALDIITADGELIHASETQNSDWLWAARGAGPGFFGAAVRYYQRLHKDPTHKRGSFYLYPVEVLEPLLTWVRDSAPAFPKPLEVAMIGNAPGGKPQIALVGTAFANSEKEAANLLAVLEACPVVERAIVRKVNEEAKVPWRTELPEDVTPTGYRFAVDNVWVSAPSEQMIPYMRDLFTDFPSEKSYVFLQCWGPPQTLTNAAYSVQGELYISVNAVYEDEADDARMEQWVTSEARKLEPIAVGSQMNDENMAGRASRYLSEEASARLEALRAKHDPQGRFVSFLKA